MTSSRSEFTHWSVNHAEPWTFADVIDFEFMLSAPEAGDDERARQRARAVIERESGGRHLIAGPAERRAVFHAWLESHRARASARLPGTSFGAGYQTLVALAVFVALVLGGSLTATLLHYKGAEPVNVTVFLAWTVGLQLAILVFGFVIAVLRKWTRAFSEWQPIRWTISGLLWIFSAGLRRLPGEQRARVRAVLAAIEQKHGLYGTLAVWPVLVVTQIFGVCFNVGILATLLAHVATTDLAFGWQSTLQTSPEQVHAMVSRVAVPWAWFAPNALPTIEQVVASRFQYAQGLQPTSAGTLAAWWPFLGYAVAFYGLLVRAILLGFAALKWRGALRELPFDHQACNALWRRLLGSVIETRNDTAALKLPGGTSATSRPHASGAAFVLVADDVTVESTRLAETLRAQFGWEIAGQAPAEIAHPTGNVESLAQLAAGAADLAGVIVLVRARRPPIKAIALFLQKIADAAGPKPELIVLLTGRPQDGGFAPVGDEEAGHWRTFATIHRLAVGVEKWSGA